MSRQELAGNNNQVPPGEGKGYKKSAKGMGYKKSAIGLIPEDWEVRELADICIKIQDGTHFSPSLGGNDYFYITSKNIGWGILNISNADKINELQHRKIYKRCDVKKGDILLTKDGVNTGNAAINYLDEEFSLLSSVAFLRFDTQKYEVGYFLQQILSSVTQNSIKELMSGNAITRLTLEKIRKIKFAIPPLPEQKTIASVLSDVDELISSLDKLIAKKRHIKTATMQQLLTGKTRLPGFGEGMGYKKSAKGMGYKKSAKGMGYKKSAIGLIPEDWDIYALEELCYAIVDGTHYTPKYVSDGIPFYSVENVTANNFNNVKFISIQEHLLLTKRCKPEKGDLLLTRIGSLGKTKLIDWDVNASIYVSLALLKLNNNVEQDFVYAYSKSQQFLKDVEKRSLVNATPQKINMQDIGKIPIPSPNKLTEQKAIASVLSDMDKEIAALEKRRAKTQGIKQGMMQELLTGRTRLINNYNGK